MEHWPFKRVAKTLNNIGEVHRRLGDFEKAMFHYNKALSIYIPSVGSGHALARAGAWTAPRLPSPRCAQADRTFKLAASARAGRDTATLRVLAPAVTVGLVTNVSSHESSFASTSRERPCG